MVLAQQGGFIAQSDLDTLKTQLDLTYQKYTQAKEDNSEEQKAHSQEQIASFERQLALLDDTVNPGAVKMPYDGVLWEVYTEEGAICRPTSRW